MVGAPKSREVFLVLNGTEFQMNHSAKVFFVPEFKMLFHGLVVHIP